MLSEHATEARLFWAVVACVVQAIHAPRLGARPLAVGLAGKGAQVIGRQAGGLLGCRIQQVPDQRTSYVLGSLERACARHNWPVFLEFHESRFTSALRGWVEHPSASNCLVPLHGADAEKMALDHGWLIIRSERHSDTLQGLESAAALVLPNYLVHACKRHHSLSCEIPDVLRPDVKLILEQILKGKMPYPNTANTALAWHHGKLLSLWEGGPPHEIKVPNLETVGRYTFGGKLTHAFTAHPKVDPKTDELIFFGYSLVPPFVQYSVANRDGTIASTTSIELPRAVMMHDMAITEKYSLFIDCPAVFDAAAVLRGKPLLNFDAKLGARIGVLPRHGTGNQIKWSEIKPCFVFHIFNAYENGDALVLHGCRFPRYPDFVDFDRPVKAEGHKQPDKASSAVAHTWRLNMATGGAAEAALDDLDSEFPRVNEAHTVPRRGTDMP